MRQPKRLPHLAASAAAALALAAAGLTFGGAPSNAAVQSTCLATYTVVNAWPGNFQAELKLTNTGATTLSSWQVGWAYAGNQKITSMWNGTYTQSGAAVTVKDAGYNGTLAPGASATAGFQGTVTGTNAAPTAFTLGGSCSGTPSSPSPSVVPSASVSPSTAPSASPSAPPVSPSTVPSVSPSPPSGVHVDNPFLGARGYVDPNWADRVHAEATAAGGTLGAKMNTVATTPTAVWLDRIAAIAGNSTSMGLVAHLDAALAQQSASGQQTVISLVIYDLPNRDCSALASNGELLIANGGMGRYKSEYIDAIAAILARPAYRNLRVAAIVEPDSLPNLITNLSFPKCAEANTTGAYEQGVAYALSKLHAISNVYTYVDIAHSGWLGWDSNFVPAVNLFTRVATAAGGFAAVDGFISNTANVTPAVEPFMTANQQIGGNPVRSATFYQWNQYIDEQSYALGMRNALIAKGFPSTLGMLIDTSRNGWGGSARPGGPSSSTTLDPFVAGSKIDRRIHRGNWCNQSGAGLGQRPTAAPAPGMDAYVWVKPPGESDGASTDIPNDEGKKFDRMCDPTYTGNTLNGNNLTGALPGAPLSGQWFSAQFRQLVENSYPAL